MRVAAGTASFKRLTRLALSSGLSGVTPVTFALGRVNVATRPAVIGSETTPKTIGIEPVALFAARAPGVENAKMASTLSRTSSVASCGSLSYLPSA